MKRNFLIVTLILCLISIYYWFLPTVKADSISVDGDFADWSQVDKTNFGSSGGKWALTVSDSQVYIYIKNTNVPSNSYDLKINGIDFYLYFNNSSSSGTVSAGNNNGFGWRDGIGQFCFKQDGNVQVCEIGLPLAKLGVSDVTAENVSLTQQGQTIKATQLSAVASSSSSSAAESSSFDSSSSATDSSSTSQSSATGNLGITINGDFSDWYDKTKSAMKENGDNDNIKYVSLLTDDKNVYFYVEMKPQLSGGYTELQPSGYKLTVGGVVYDIDFNNNKSVSLSKGQIKELSVGIYNEKTGSYTVLNNQVAVKYQKITQEMGDSSSVDGWGAVLECEIPFSALTSSSNTAGQVITLANRNLWEGQVTASGGSTRPFILALISFLVAVGALWMIFKKQQTRSDQGSK